MRQADRRAAEAAGRAAAPRVLVLRALGLGDLLTAVPALRAIGRAFPDHAVTLAAPRALAPLVDLIGDLTLLDHHELERPLPRAAHHARVAINLHGRGPRSHARLLDTRPERLLAFAHPDVARAREGPPWRADEHEVHRWCRMLDAHGIPADPEDLALPAPERPVPAYAPGATLIHPGAKDPSRRWPISRWAAVAHTEHARGRTVLITGGPDERILARAVAEQAGLPPGAVLAGRTDLADLAALVAAAGRVVCGDTGLAHLATALGTPSAVLFGPVPPAEWGPPPDRPRHRVLWAGRRGDPHGQRPDAGLLAIRPDDVLEQMEALP